MEQLTDMLIRDIQSLTAEQASQVEDLSSSLRTEESKGLHSLSEPAFAQVWNDPENDVYDTV